MKTAPILSSLIVAFIFTTACTPADKAVIDTKTRLDLQEQSKRKSGGGSAGQGKGYFLGGYQSSSLLMDKQIEAIELVRLALQIDDGTKAGSQKKEKVESDKGHKAVLSMGSAPLMFSNQKGDFEYKTSKVLNLNLEQEVDSETWNLKLSNKDSAKQTLDKKGGEKGFVNLFEKSFEVTAATKNQENVTIKLTAAGDINGRLGQTSFKEAFEMKLSLIVDKASLNSENVKILKSSGEIAYKKADGKVFKTTIEGANQELQADGLCNSLLGSATITSDRAAKKIEFSKNDVSVVGTNFKKDLAPCGKRPTVDLSRLLP